MAITIPAISLGIYLSLVLGGCGDTGPNNVEVGTSQVDAKNSSNAGRELEQIILRMEALPSLRVHLKTVESRETTDDKEVTIIVPDRARTETRTSTGIDEVIEIGNDRFASDPKQPGHYIHISIRHSYEIEDVLIILDELRDASSVEPTMYGYTLRWSPDDQLGPRTGVVRTYDGYLTQAIIEYGDDIQRTVKFTIPPEPPVISVPDPDLVREGPATEVPPCDENGAPPAGSVSCFSPGSPPE